MIDDCISEKDNILINKNNFITTLVWGGLLDKAKCGELARAIDLCVVEQEPCADCISRQAVLELMADYDLSMGQVVKGIHALPSITPKPKTGKWILVSERLPEEYREIIVTDVETSATYLSRYIGDGYWECDNGLFKDRIIAWMPLPEPYEESEIENVK